MPEFDPPYEHYAPAWVVYIAALVSPLLSVTYVQYRLGREHNFDNSKVCAAVNVLCKWLPREEMEEMHSVHIFGCSSICVSTCMSP